MADPESTEQPDLATRISELEKQLTEERQTRQVVERTLAALRDEPPTRQVAEAPTTRAQTLAMFGAMPRDAQEQIKQALGWDDQNVQQHWQIIATFLDHMARPLIQQIGGALNTLADYADQHHVRLTIQDYAGLADDVETERKSRAKRGEPAVSREELYHLVKARKLPEIVERETQKRMDEEKQRAASAASATTEGTETAGVHKAGPAATKPATPRGLTKEQLDALPREERIKAIEQGLEGSTF